MDRKAKTVNLSHKVIRHIFNAIEGGTLKIGDKLPTNRELASELGISILTVQRSMKQLEAQGVVSCQRRSGTFLVDSSKIESPRIQSDLVGLFIPEFSSDFHTDLLLELEEGMMEAGKMLSINFTRSEPERELKLLRTIARQRLEALIFVPSPLTIRSESHSNTMRRWAQRYVSEGTQVIFADLCPRGSENRLVSIDDEKAGELLTQQLIAKGHKNIAFVGPAKLHNSLERRAGYEKALAEANLPIREDWFCPIAILDGKDWIQHSKQKMLHFMDDHPSVTGFVICDQSSALSTYTILNACSEERSFSASDSIAALFEHSKPPFDALAWIHIPGKRMGKKICQLLLENGSANQIPGPVKIEPTLWQA